MALDPYAPCPCGSGKKLKFCCHDLAPELEKVRNVIARKIPGSPHEVLLVLDATNGQNAIRQAEVFTQSIGCTGIILTKLDGTAKGGVVVAVKQAMDLPIKFVGVGEAIDDLQPFDPDALLAHARQVLGL